MDPIKDINENRRRLADVYIGERERIEKLRLILEREQGRPFSFKEAQEIGTELLGLYKTLAGRRKIVRGGLKNRERLSH